MPALQCEPEDLSVNSPPALPIGMPPAIPPPAAPKPAQQTPSGGKTLKQPHIIRQPSATKKVKSENCTNGPQPPLSAAAKPAPAAKAVKSQPASAAAAPATPSTPGVPIKLKEPQQLPTLTTTAGMKVSSIWP